MAMNVLIDGRQFVNNIMIFMDIVRLHIFHHFLVQRLLVFVCGWILGKKFEPVHTKEDDKEIQMQKQMDSTSNQHQTTVDVNGDE